MGRCMRKGGGISELTVMEVSQFVGVRTRAMTMALAEAEKAAKRRKTEVTASDYQIGYLQLRSRSLVMTTTMAVPQISRSGVRCSDYGSPRCLTPDRGEISRCESNASCDLAVLRSDDQRKVGEDSETAACCSSLRRLRETTPSSSRRGESCDVESTAERRSAAPITPSEAEIEEFFASAEEKLTQQFASTYNFDVANDVPLVGGRYEWVRVSPP